MSIRVFESFAGVGTQHMALNRLRKDFNLAYEVVGISEIEESAIRSYEAIHGKVVNFGDISKLKASDIPDLDLFTYSFPCQNLTNEGKREGLKGSRSGLLYECEKIIEEKKPKYLLLENVMPLVNKHNKPDFDKWLEWLEGQGYDNYWQVLNGKDYGIPQIRKRVFCVSIRKDLNQMYEFPEPIKLEKTLLSLLENEIDNNLFIKDANKDALTWNGDGMPVVMVDGKPKVKIVNSTKQGYLLAGHGDGVDLQFPNSKTRKGRVQEGKIHTLNTGGNYGVVLFDENNNFNIKKLSPLEYWRLMGIDDEHFYRAKEAGAKDKELYKQAGNAIVVDVLYHIFRELLVRGEQDVELSKL